MTITRTTCRMCLVRCGMLVETGDEPDAESRPEGALAKHFGDRCQANGLFVRPIGGAAVLAPPLIITADEIGEMLDSLGQALDETADWAAGRGLLS